jgi:hypothetical protein
MGRYIYILNILIQAEDAYTEIKAFCEVEKYLCFFGVEISSHVHEMDCCKGLATSYP